MIVDSSALIAMLAMEDDGPVFADKLDENRGKAIISAANYLEAGIVTDGPRNPERSAKLDQIIDELDIAIAPVTESQARIARQAYREFGKGSGHAAKLNFGDCFAYALATERGEALLFKGDDFGHTGVRRA